MFKNKTLLITGGTGSFGKTVLNSVLSSDIEKVIIFSRDEAKQELMRQSIADCRVHYIVGDIRDKESLLRAFINVDFIFHAAALKQVPSCESNPIEAVKTNIIGSDNVISAAIERNVERVVCLSTDKAVHPVNAMGMSKSLMEKLVQSYSSYPSSTIISCTRYGNVIASRGSVVPLFVDQIKSSKPLTITNPNMTRFLMTLDDAVDLVYYAFTNAVSGDVFVKKSPSATVQTIANAVKSYMNVSPFYEQLIVGDRQGEKMHESLLSCEEASIALDSGDYFKLSYDNSPSKLIPEYSSGSIDLLSEKEVYQLLLKANF